MRSARMSRYRRSVDLQAAIDRALRRLAGEELCHRRFVGYPRRALVLLGRRSVNEHSRGVDFGSRFGEQELNALQRRQRAAELATLLGVGNGLVERAPGHSDRGRPH